MNRYGAEPGAMPGAAFATVHRDPQWWAKCLLYGALSLTIIGLPLAAGFVLESYDNSRKGYPTPLPPWGDWTTRWLGGLFALLVDFAFFVLPLILGGMLLVCVSVGLIVANLSGGASVAAAVGLIGWACGLFALTMFALSVAPAGRLRLADEGRPEQAIGAETLRWATSPPARGLLARARLASLPAYLPALLIGGATLVLARQQFPGQLAAVAVLLWLAASALVYAHLVGAQVYVAAERELQRRRLGM